MWLPRWLGEVYAKLYAELNTDLFTFEKARSLLEAKRAWLNVAFSKLHEFRALYIYSRTRPRLYGLLKPETFVLMASGMFKNLDKVRQERYLQLICDVTTSLVKRHKAESVCLYGSVARGKARLDSDLDFLVVSDAFKGSLSSRIEELCQVDEEVAGELRRLRKLGVYTSLSFYPLRKEEVLRFPPILLDLTVEGIIVHDRELFLEKALAMLRDKLVKLGAKRISIDEETWYWDLKPDYVFGEAIEL
ncbi:MAG: hypothetical protein DRJ98_03165 [Thermoprotei archaeon]|nr:MAG: hypothetical protein DRJ98_03165 [Thermoprotei archaeon]